VRPATGISLGRQNFRDKALSKGEPDKAHGGIKMPRNSWLAIRPKGVDFVAEVVIQKYARAYR
jgi:hypothetical protein